MIGVTKVEIGDIANCGLFLASEESSFITGQEIIVDGGLMVKGR